MRTIQSRRLGRSAFRDCAILAALALLVVGSAGTFSESEASVGIGERPAVERHLDQTDIESGDIKLKELFHFGRILFEAVFNTLDGQGRPASTGTGTPRIADQPSFIRTSAPDASSCFGCHNQPRSGGAGDFVANVFVLAQARDPVTFSVAASESNERNTLGMFGAGPIEMLAREMSRELIAIREGARAEAKLTGLPVTRPLLAKGVSFGWITVLPSGMVDPSRIEGVDWDLIVKPFHQKGAVVSLREFTNNAMNHHHGMQSVERFGAGQDPDQDGLKDELTVGDITAATIFQAALSTPGRLLPSHAVRRRVAELGERIFAEVGCATCHIPSMVLNSGLFTEPNPFNPPGNLRPSDASRQFAFDMTREGPGQRLERLPGGRAVVRAFTDLKRHDLNDADYFHFTNEQLPQGMLSGFDSPGSFTVPPTPRPLSQFLTRKLWDVGNSAPYGHRGDLTMLTEVIQFHGGEARPSHDAFLARSSEDQAAVIEFLKTLQVLPEGTPRVMVQPADPFEQSGTE